MSLFGMMRTGVSGMNAQATRLATVADNIANSSTTGYKRSKTEFSTLVLPNTGTSYASGGVTNSIQTMVTKQGVLQYTTSTTDLAIDGEGFFIVQDSAGNPFLTRAGSFVPNDKGELVNAAGFKLLGYSYENGAPTVTANGFAGLEPVIVVDNALTATASQSGYYTANLPSEAAVGDSFKTSLVMYDNAGGEKLVDITFTKTAANTWEAEAPLTGDTATLTFDPVTRQLTGPTSLSVDLTGLSPAGNVVAIDLSAMTELATGFTPSEAFVDGNPPSGIDVVEIATDGTVYAQYTDGSFRALYRVPVATVQSPDRLQVLPGNTYSQSSDSGPIRIGFPGEGSLGSVVSGALESSNVDIAEELTAMIESQRSYTANSKVFQTGSDLMDVLVNLKR